MVLVLLQVIKKMSIPCTDVECDQMFETTLDMLMHYTEPGSHQEQIDSRRDHGVKCPSCSEYVSFDDIGSHSNTHIRNRDASIVPPLSYKVSCLLDHMNTDRTVTNEAQHMYLSLIFDGCVFYRGAKRTTALSKSGLVHMRHELFNRFSPNNTKILKHMRDSWSTDEVPSADSLFLLKANNVRGKRSAKVNLLHLGLYVIFTHVHRRYNTKTMLFKQPDEFPMTLDLQIRELLSCMSQYFEAALQTVFTSDAMKRTMVDTQVGECSFCSEEDVPCVSLCSTGSIHAVCKNCTMTVVMEKLLADKDTITTIYDVVCPFSLGDVPIHSIRPQVIKWAVGPFEYLERMQKAQETALALVVVIKCPNTQCTHTFTQDSVKNASVNRVCPSCRVSICQYCNMLSHTVYSTPACAQSLVLEHKDLLEQGGTLCPSCKNVTMRDDEDMPSCIHMRCQCGHHYCWVCLGDWNGHAGPNMFYSCRKAKNDETYGYDDAIRRYYPKNPLTTFDTIDLGRLPRLYSTTIDKYRQWGGIPLPEILIPDGRTICPNCFVPAAKLPTAERALCTHCMSCNHEYCWQCLRPEVEHKEEPFQRSTCSLDRLPSYYAFYEDFRRLVYPGTSNITFDRVVQSDWPYLTFKPTVEPNYDERHSVELLQVMIEDAANG